MRPSRAATRRSVQIRSDLNRILGWSGVLGVSGAGVRVDVNGALPGDAVEQLLNELRNAGAEAISIGGIRIVPGVVVAGPADAVTVGGTPLSGALEILAVGHPESLAGSLARAGGPIAQLAARYPDVTVTVNDVDLIQVPATTATSTPVARPAAALNAAGPSEPRRHPLLPSAPMSGHPVLELFLGDVVRLRRRHPCGGDTWLVDRLGADIGLRCETCDRHVLLERAALERRITGFVRRGDPVLSAAVGPRAS